ncbi:MAG TPA: hypothetical protein EYP04_04265, partial [Anaerolineae bacterium]|nr:hypothetical protein [Anaerolineae bacterium]HIQ06715.1 hypothetical protein [Anaerolineae bacterium]
DYRNGYSDIFVAHSDDQGTTWSLGVRVNDDAGDNRQYNPHLALDEAGTLYAVWWDDRSGNNLLYIASSTDQGQSWSTNMPVPPASGLESWRGVDMAAGTPDHLYLAWEQSGNIWFSESNDSGATWSAAHLVNDSGTNNRYAPVIAVGGDGTVHVTWYDYRNGNADIYYAVRDPAGIWGPNLRVNDDGGSMGQYDPDLVVDSLGNVHLIWGDYRNGNGDIYYAYKPAGGVWSVNGKVDDAILSTQSFPRLAVDGAGNVYAAWIDQRDGPQHPYFAYMQHTDLPTRAPAPQITFPFPGTTNQNTFAVQGLACAGCQVSVYDGSTRLVTTTVTDNGTFSATITLADGSHALSAVAEHTPASTARLAPAAWLPSRPSATVDLTVDSRVRIDPQRLTLSYTMWGGQQVVLRPRDASGLLVSCAGGNAIPGFRIRPGLPNILTVPVSGSPTHVQAVITGTGVFDLAPIGNDLWQVTFTVTATHDLSIRLSDDGGSTFTDQCSGQVLIDPQGIVSDADSGLPIQGATVTCYVADESGTWTHWPAENYDGQTNPQYTDTDGFYAFFTPPGSYQIEAWAPGYELTRTGAITVTGQLVEVNLTLQPTSTPCPGDLNGDGDVTVTDIIAVADKWNAVSPDFPYAPGFDVAPVGAPDGTITIADVQVVAGAWGEACTP